MCISLKYTGHTTWKNVPYLVYPAINIDGDIILEIGPGRGDFLFHLARKNPEKVVYGVEIKSLRFDKLMNRREKFQLKNVRLVLGDARNVVPQIFGKNSITAIYINFPDPWPKRKHRDNRLLSKSFLEICTNILSPGGTLFIATDVEWYAKETFCLCRKIEGLKAFGEDVTTESDESYPTYFAEKWKKQGRQLYYQKHIKENNHSL